MYRLKYFSEADNEKVLAFMKAYSFVTITGTGSGYPVATHVPLEIINENGRITFTGHIMRNSDHHKAFLENDRVLVIFNGPHCHLSASWYPNPVQASTWNYITVHAKGKISFGDEVYTRKIVEDLTNKYETEESAAAFKNLPSEYIDRLVKGIVGFIIQVEDIENVFKLSQNHDEATRQAIIKQLQLNGSEDEIKIAAEMEQRIHLPKQKRE